MTTVGLEKVTGKLTSNMLFFLLHLLFQMRQQRLARLTDSEGDCVEVVAGGLQCESVQGQEANHRPAVGESAEKQNRSC